MIRTEPASASASARSAIKTVAVTVYGCDGDEAILFRELAPGLGVTPTLTEALLTEATVELAYGHRCVSVSHKADVTHAALRALSRAGVRYVSTRSIGCNHIDVEYAERVGLTVGTVAYSPDSVADYTVMLMLMLVRRVSALIRRAEAHDYRLSQVPGRELRDLAVGVIGTGRIGTAVIDRLQGFGCELLTHDSRALSAGQVSLGELLARSDVVTLHTPLTAETHHLLDRHRIEQMKPGAFIINTARGALVDTDALIAALESGALGGAALDVLEGEEGIFYADRRHLPPESKQLRRLRRLPNVVISPHTAYYTDHALRDIVENTLRSCLAFDRGEHHG